MKKKLMLIDGHSILNRAFYGMPELTNSQGQPTGAVYGFLNIMFRMLEEEKPDCLAVAFDVHAPTFRHEIYKEYKGTRKPMPEELRTQVPIIKEVLCSMGILIMEQAGLEADDILGTMAKRGEAAGLEVTLISGDRDLLQIASDHIKIRIPKTKGGKTEIEDYYAADVKAKYQVTPLQFIDLKALMGDTADNIPGVPKVGEKSATELMVEFGSLEGIYAHLDEVRKKSIRETLAENRDKAELSRVLAAINIDCDIPYQIEETERKDFYTKEAFQLLKQLEFKNLLGRFQAADEPNVLEEYFRQIRTVHEAEAVFALGEEAGRIGFFHEEEAGIGLCFGEEKIFFIWYGEELTREKVGRMLSDLIFSEKRKGLVSSFDMKKAYALFDMNGTGDTKKLFDILIAAYLLNPLKNDYEIEDIAHEHLELDFQGKVQLFGKKGWEKTAAQEPEKLAGYVCFCAYTAYQSCEVLEKKLKKTGMYRLFREIEMPLSYVLYDMEETGIKVRPEELKQYGEELSGRIAELETDIYRQAGTEFNINSPKQLGEVLFEKMQIPGGKKTKTGYSTAADVLEKLAQEYPIVNGILEYRGLTKLKSTYADGLAVYIDETHRIHSSFNQTITATGRISSTEPNLQNIPMKMELGRLIRKAFVPGDGRLFMDADYSQIELRVLAHMSGDDQLIEAYRMDEDIHRITASKVFHTPFEEVTDLQRSNAKAVNFGIVYGISSFGLSQDLSISRKEANEYIEQYFQTYPQVKTFLEKLVEDAKRDGYVTTMYGRRRPVPELSSSNFMQRSFGERIAMNSPIQGTAADIIKIAMIRVWEALRKAGMKTNLILQVHDELLLEVYEEEAAQAEKILRDNMKTAAELSVSLEVDLHTGKNWYEAK